MKTQKNGRERGRVDGYGFGGGFEISSSREGIVRKGGRDVYENLGNTMTAIHTQL